MAKTGVFVHAKLNEGGGQEEVAWFSPKWTCCADNSCYHGGDAIMLYIGTENYNGAWCDWDSSRSFTFICEAMI